MDTKDAQDLMRRIYLERDKKRGVSIAILRTFEELAELSEAVTRGEPEAIEEEVADVFAWLCSIANLMDVDIGDSLTRKYQNACSKCGMIPCTCEI